MLARSVWKQEVLWAEAPVADVGVACEEHYHFVLDISGNRELMEGHTKAGQFVQVSFLSISFPGVFTVMFGPMSYSSFVYADIKTEYLGFLR